MWKTSTIQFFKIILKNKFFTFLNLFGISITIMIILIAAVKIENTIWPGGPEDNNENILFVSNQLLVSDEHMSMGGINLALIEDYFMDMETPEAIAFFNETRWSYFGENGVEEYSVKKINSAWWQVFNYEFVEGRPTNAVEEKNSSNVVVIDERVKNRFFPDKNAEGELLEISGKIYKVVGVVKEIPNNCVTTHANIFIPYTLTDGYLQEIMETGSFTMALLSTGKENQREIKKEFDDIRLRIIPMLTDGYRLMFGGPDGPVEQYLRGWEDPENYIGHKNELLIILGKFLLVMLLPALNLISIQLIRIHERSEEIGVRKAFGASRKKLIRQILFENTLLTFIGGMLGLLFAIIVVYGFNDFIVSTLFNDLGTNISISINYVLFLICLVSSLILSFISGMIPAIKMSRVQPVEVLKGGEL
jgi:putative ABC transport system permease protein